MKWKGWQQLRANAKKGISMALVLCVSAFFIAFAAAILYTAGMLTAQSNQRLKEERCYQLAKSYSDVLKTELTKYDNKYTDDGNVTGDGSFYAFANKFLDDEKYLEYNSDYEDSTKYHFVVDGSNVSDLSQSPLPEKGYGNLSVTLKKEKNTDENKDTILSSGQIKDVSANGNYTSTIDTIENTTLRQYIFTVEVTAYYEDASYTYSTEYTRAEKYPVTFQQNNKTIVWVKNATGGGKWKLGNTAGADYQIDEKTPIVYSYLKSSPTSCKFEENTYQDSQGGGGTDAAN